MPCAFHFEWQGYVDAVQYVSPLPLPRTTGALVPSLVICHILSNATFLTAPVACPIWLHCEAVPRDFP